MTTFKNGGGSPDGPPEPAATENYPAASSELRRSPDERMLSGVAGGLAEYFQVDPVLFRVAFAVLALFGGAGLLIYLLCWLLIPERGAPGTVLDRVITQLRVRRIPPWLVIIGGALVLWIATLSWWVPWPSFPALAAAAALIIVLVYRKGRIERQATTEGPVRVELSKQAAEPPLGSHSERTNRAAMQLWFNEAAEKRRVRRARRRPIKVGIAAGLLVGWAIVVLVDMTSRTPMPAYLWVGLGVLAIGFIVGLFTRRQVWGLLPLIAVFAGLLIAFGSTKASLRDGAGDQGWAPTTAADVRSDYRQFAGRATLDLSNVSPLATPDETTVTQAAGEVEIKIPRALNARVIADVRFGDAQLDRSEVSTEHVSGNSVELNVPPAAGATGAELVIHVQLAAGHVQIQRVG